MSKPLDQKRIAKLLGASHSEPVGPGLAGAMAGYMRAKGAAAMVRYRVSLTFDGGQFIAITLDSNNEENAIWEAWDHLTMNARRRISKTTVKILKRKGVPRRRVRSGATTGPAGGKTKPARGID